MAVKKYSKTREVLGSDGGKFLVGVNKDGSETVIKTISPGRTKPEIITSTFSGLGVEADQAARKKGLASRWG